MPEHAHHWRIEEPNGSTVHGVCLLCGAERDWPTWLTDAGIVGNHPPGVSRLSMPSWRIQGGEGWL